MAQSLIAQRSKQTCSLAGKHSLTERHDKLLLTYLHLLVCSSPKTRTTESACSRSQTVGIMQTDFKAPVEATTNNDDDPAQTASSSENSRLGSSQLERPSTPTELPLRATETNRRSRLLGYNMNQSSHVRTMSYDQTSRPSGPQPLDDHRGRDFENIALAEIQPTVQTWDIEPPRRTFRNSLHRISNRLSLTPSDSSIAYPTPLFPQRKGKDEPHKAEMILGLRPDLPSHRRSHQKCLISMPRTGVPLPPFHQKTSRFPLDWFNLSTAALLGFTPSLLCSWWETAGVSVMLLACSKLTSPTSTSLGPLPRLSPGSAAHNYASYLASASLSADSSISASFVQCSTAERY
jgi:hypothetical protein